MQLEVVLVFWLFPFVAEKIRLCRLECYSGFWVKAKVALQPTGRWQVRGGQ